MSSHAFDRLTRTLGKATTRREVIQLLGGGLAGSFLAYFGIGCDSSDPATPDPDPNECSTASSCGDRQFCSEDESCICIRSAEGVLRCGQLPSSCDLQPCTRTSDCANLGEGYFCDSQASGCCSDTEQYCIAPCGTDGGNGGGGGGGATVVCASDMPTPASVTAAVSAIRAGSSDVSLSPGGCVRYLRQFSGGTLVREEVRLDGTSAATIEHAGQTSTGSYDNDLDGFAEVRLTATRSSSGEPESAEVTVYDRDTGALVRRTTYTFTDADTMHVVVEEDRGSGLEVVVEYDAPRLQPYGLGVPVLAQAAPGSCPADIQADATERLHRMSALTSACLGNHGLQAEAALLAAYAARVRFTCDPMLQGTPAAVDTADVLTPGADIEIILHPDSYTAADSGLRDRILSHEMLHTVLPEDHNPLLDDAAPPDIARENDRVRACNSLCHNPDATRCDCAKCLRQSRCEPPCTSYEDCATQDTGGLCLCPQRRMFYPQFSTCVVECPSGLACFGYQCMVVDNPCRG